MDDYDQKIADLEEKIQTLEKSLYNPEIVKNIDKTRKLSKEFSEAKNTLDNWKSLKNITDEINDAKEILGNSDAEMKTLAEEELKDLEAKRTQILSSLSNENLESSDKQNECIVEIRAGTGGEEANLFAGDLFRMFTKYALSKEWTISVVNEHKSGIGGFKEIIFEINGKNAYSLLKFENGVHRVQRVPSTESSGRIHTSAASVVIYPVVEEQAVEISPNDLKIDVYRSTGAGGQSVNTTDSAVRITHLPTGIVVTCQDEKSQHKNKARAMKILASKLVDKQKQEEASKISSLRKDAIKTGDRSAKIRTYNFPQSRITDHRIKKSWHNLKQILNGELDIIINEFSKYT